MAPAVPTAARGHLCGRITDTLTASRHRDECSFTQNDDNRCPVEQNVESSYEVFYVAHLVELCTHLLHTLIAF